MSHQNNGAFGHAQVSSLEPEPEKKEFSKSGVPLHMMRDGLQIEENIPAEDMPEMGIDEALTTL
jgi:hypothetical protein|tara:strand:+ start:353 stop:544 length:192 start_codon:yes stop_codon:yes gene_type:complete